MIGAPKACPAWKTFHGDRRLHVGWYVFPSFKSQSPLPWTHQSKGRSATPRKVFRHAIPYGMVTEQQTCAEPGGRPWLLGSSNHCYHSTLVVTVQALSLRAALIALAPASYVFLACSEHASAEWLSGSATQWNSGCTSSDGCRQCTMIKDSACSASSTSVRC